MIECTPGSDNGLNQSFFVQLFPSSAFSELVSSSFHDTSKPLLFSLSTHQVKEQSTNRDGRAGSSNDHNNGNNDKSNTIVRNSISSVIPRFLVENLTPGLSYTAIIYSWNVKGRSSGHILKSIKLGSEKRSSSVSSSGSIISSNFDISSDQTGSSHDDDNLFERYYQFKLISFNKLQSFLYFSSKNILLLVAIIIVASALVTLSIGVLIKKKKGGRDGRKRSDDDENEKVEMEEK